MRGAQPLFLSLIPLHHPLYPRYFELIFFVLVTGKGEHLVSGSLDKVINF